MTVLKQELLFYLQNGPAEEHPWLTKWPLAAFFAPSAVLPASFEKCSKSLRKRTEKPPWRTRCPPAVFFAASAAQPASVEQ